MHSARNQQDKNQSNRRKIHDQVDQEQTPGGAGPANTETLPHGHLVATVFIFIHHTDDGGFRNIACNRHDDTHDQHDQDEDADDPEKVRQCLA